jgi:hypothetical protein
MSTHDEAIAAGRKLALSYDPIPSWLRGIAILTMGKGYCVEVWIDRRLEGKVPEGIPESVDNVPVRTRWRGSGQRL